MPPNQDDIHTRVQHFFMQALLFLSLGIATVSGHAAPGAILFSDDFQTGSLSPTKWTVTKPNGSAGDAGVSANNVVSGSRSMFTRWGAVTVTSNSTILANVPAAMLSLWIRRGADALHPNSEDPDSGENLVIEYLDNVGAGTWRPLETFLGSGTKGEVLTRSYILPSDALHDNLAIRIRQTGGSGSTGNGSTGYDYWHIDDVAITETAPPPPPPTGASCEDFESGALPAYWTVDRTGGGDAGVSTSNVASGSRSMYTRWNRVSVATQAIDMSGGGSVSFWVRRGFDSSTAPSEDPEASDEDLFVEYWDGSAWQYLADFQNVSNGNPAGQTFTRNITLSGSALHPGFKLRFRQTGGDGSSGNGSIGYDYWHVDDVCMTPGAPVPPTPLAYYTLDDSSFVTTVVNSGSGSDGIGVNNATPLDTDAERVVPGSPGTCGFADIPKNTSNTTYDAIDSRIDVNTIGDRGTISFWYKSNEKWNGNEGDRMLLDASTTSNGRKYFFLMLKNNSKLRFGLEDSADNDFIVETGNNSFKADVWVHIAITWDMDAGGSAPGNTMEIYINGSLRGSNNSTTNGTLGNLDTIYLGDNRSTYQASGSSGNSANGSIDEVYFYNAVRSPAQIQTDRDAVHPCVGGFGHYAITHNGPGITCAPTTITVTGHNTGDTAIAPPAGTVITVSINNNTAMLGSWSGTGVTAIANNSAQYTFDGTQTSAVLDLLYPLAGTININVSDGSYSESTSEDPDLVIGRAKFLFSSIPTQISGKSSSTLTLQAVRASDDDATVCVPGFPDGSTPSIDLAAECTNPTSCAGRQISITNGGNPPVNIATNNDNAGAAGTTAYTAIPLLFGMNATASFTINYPDAGQMQLHALYNISNTDFAVGTSGSSNPFVVRPFGVAFTDVRNYGADSTYGNADDVLNPGGTASSGSGFIAAEDVFRVTLRGYQYDPADDLLDNITGLANPDGIPDVGADITDNGNGDTPNFAWDTALSTYATGGFSPVGGSAGSLAGTTTVASASYSGGITNSAGDLTYDEAGSVTLQALAADYISTGVNVFGYSLPVGRFFPHHFSLESSLVTAANGAFTYMGQDALGIDFTLAARGANGALLSNYDDSLGYANTASILSAAENDNDGVALDARISDPVGNWAGGNYIYSSVTETFARSAAGPDGPYQALQLSINVASEADNRDIENLDEKSSQNNNCVTDNNCTSRAIGNITDVRFGRLRLANAFGSELLDLSIPVSAEYYNSGSSGFVANPDDGTTSYSALAGAADAQPISLSNYLGNLDPGETTASGNGTLITGMGDPANPIILSRPGAGNDGSVTVNLAAPAWLQFDWDGDGSHDNDPSATATFGIFHGNDATIYRRELY